MKISKLPKLLYLLLLTGLIAARPLTAQAQTSITAAPDGTGTIINYNGNTYHINGGTQAGANLFHSFQEFGLNPQEIANFLSNPNILNVVGRVTGGNPSIIQGLIQLTGGNSNLFLMNPSGWVFTQGASLDVPGSFGATTATRIGFGNNYFNAYGDNDYSQLIGSPTSLIFDQNNPSWIVNEADLAVPTGESLWMVGGGIISTGTVATENGNITLAAIPGKSQVRLSHEGMVVNLVLDAAPVEGSVNIPGNLMGIRAVDIPRYITGGSEIGHANEVIIEEDGTVRLIRTDTAVSEGDTVIAGEVNAENINLMAAGVVTPTNPSLIQGDTTVVRFPEAGGTNILNVIDSHADNAEDLLYGAAAGTISSIIGREEEGIAAITEKLEEVDGELDGIAITAEGNEGNFWLGKTWVTNENINNYAGQLATWAKSLDEGADILLYSCFTALGEAGQALIGDLAKLTGADVAASTNATGSANNGGDWVLESSTGNIELSNPFTDATLANWDGRLATFTVENGNDAGADSLREEIANANGLGGADDIRFANGVTLVTLTSAELEITDELTISGGATNVTIERDAGAGNFRIFNVTANVPTTFDNLTIQNGSVAFANGGGLFTIGNITLTNSTVSGNSSTNGRGGGLSASGNITLTNSTVSGNSAANIGGGLRASGNITLTNSTVSGNSSGNNGGGMYAGGGGITLTNSTVSGNDASGNGGGLNAGGGDITLTNSTVSGNGAGDSGGGLYAYDGDITLTNSTVSGNGANGAASGTNGNGGGLLAGGGMFATNGDITLTNSTVSGNSANDNGGGLSAKFNITLTNSTIAFNVTNADNNSTGDGGGIFIGGTGIINNSIIAQNQDLGGQAPDLSGTFDTIQSSLIGNTTGATITTSTNNLINVDPLLLPLGNYGGVTQTHALSLSSPALNAGSNALAAGLSTDQRGAPGARIVDGTVDMGAFEWQGSEITPIGNQNITISSLPSTLDVSVKVVEKVFNLALGVGATINFSTIGDVTGSFSNGTSVITDASGIALNFFNLTAATGDFQILAGVTGLDTLTFKITNNVATDFSFLSEIEQEFDSLEIREEDILFARGCLSTPEDELTQQDKEEQENNTSEEGEDEEIVAGEENEDSSPGSDRACRPIGDDSEGGGEE